MFLIFCGVLSSSAQWVLNWMSFMVKNDQSVQSRFHARNEWVASGSSAWGRGDMGMWQMSAKPWMAWKGRTFTSSLEIKGELSPTVMSESCMLSSKCTTFFHTGLKGHQ